VPVDQDNAITAAGIVKGQCQAWSLTTPPEPVASRLGPFARSRVCRSGT
jgi:hypothetical protein